MSFVDVGLDRLASPDRAALVDRASRYLLRQVFGVTSLEETLLDVVVLTLTFGTPPSLRHLVLLCAGRSAGN